MTSRLWHYIFSSQLIVDDTVAMTPFYLLLGKHRHPEEAAVASVPSADRTPPLPHSSAAVKEVGSDWLVVWTCSNLDLTDLLCPAAPADPGPCPPLHVLPVLHVRQVAARLCHRNQVSGLSRAKVLMQTSFLWSSSKPRLSNIVFVLQTGFQTAPESHPAGSLTVRGKTSISFSY